MMASWLPRLTGALKIKGSNGNWAVSAVPLR